MGGVGSGIRFGISGVCGVGNGNGCCVIGGLSGSGKTIGLDPIVNIVTSFLFRSLDKLNFPFANPFHPIGFGSKATQILIS